MTTVISVKLDKQVKDSAQEVAKSMGLTLSALINSYLRQVSVTRRVQLYAPEVATPKMEKLLAEIEADIKRGDTVGPFNSAQEFLDKLHKKPQ